MSKRLYLSFLAVLLVALMPLSAASQGQEMPPAPATPVPGEAPVGVLAEFEIDELPTPHAEIWFLRMGLEPNGSLPLGEQAGPKFLVVESGTLTVETDTPGVMTDAASPGAPLTNVLATGASIRVESGTDMSLTNPNEEPTTFLVLLMFSAMMEGQGGDQMAEPVGLSQAGIAVGTAEFMPIPATVTIERIVVAPGTSLEPDIPVDRLGRPGYMGMELGNVETGTAEATMTRASMDNMVWPELSTRAMPEPTLISMSGTVTLATGDAYSANGSTVTLVATGEEPLTVLRAVILPAIGMP